jgi:3-oxoacyl-[acyl-carrier-protein] synthase-3
MISTLETNPAIIGIGMGVPSRMIYNDALALKIFEHGGQVTDDEAIRQRTGIESRYWAGEGEDVVSLGIAATHEALDMANLDPRALGDIYVGTYSPYVPNVASRIHGAIGADETCGALDVSAACAGGTIALELAIKGMLAGQTNALAVGADILSRITDLSDRNSAILFGDAAGVAPLGWVPGAVKPVWTRITHPDKDAIYLDQATQKIVMQGRRVAEHALYVMPEATRRVAQKAGIADPEDPKAKIDWSQVDYLIPHQANKRLIEAAGEVLEVPEGKLITDSVEVHGNTSAATIFLAIGEAYRRGNIAPGLKNVIFTAIGAGIVGAAVRMSIYLPERSFPTIPAQVGLGLSPLPILRRA